MEGRSINSKDYEKLYYQLKKFEVLIKRKAGIYCFLDWKNKRIIASGEQMTFAKHKIAKNKQTKKIIDWLKKVNIRLEEEDLLGGKVLANSKNVWKSRKTKNNSLSV